MILNLFNISKMDYSKYFENNNAQRQTSMKNAREKKATKNNNRCNTPLQCQLEPRQCDGFNQLQVETKDCSKMDH
jgi:hydrogenase maturation factor